MITTLLLAALAGAARAEMSAASLPPVKTVPESQRASAVQLWKLGLGFFSEGDLERTRALWFSCGTLDPANEDCRKSLQGLDHLAPLRAAVPAPASTLSAGPAYGPDLPAKLPPKEAPQPPGKAIAPAGKAGPKEGATLMARASSEENKASALIHWNEGVGFFQKGEFGKARDAWALCNVLDASNQDCLSGLKKAEQGLAKVPSIPAASFDEKQEAVRHWNSGITYFQKGDFLKAREEWQICLRHDPGNGDCQTGVQRMEQASLGIQ